jgi:hypothetical protein
MRAAGVDGEDAEVLIPVDGSESSVLCFLRGQGASTGRNWLEFVSLLKAALFMLLDSMEYSS